MSGGGLVPDGHGGVRREVPVKATGLCSGGSDMLLPLAPVPAENLQYLPCQIRWISPVGVNNVVTADLGDGSFPCGDHGDAGHHGLQDWQAEALVKGGEHE